MKQLFRRINITKQFSIHWPLLLPICVYLFINAPLVTMKNIVTGLDNLTLFYPAAHAMKQALSAGTLPHWTANIQSGFPLLPSGQPSILYPINFFLIKFLPIHAAYNMMILVHGLLAVVFTYGWGRTLKLSAQASALMSCLFVLTTPLLGGNLPMLEALTWTPVLFLFTERSLQKNKLLSLWPISLIIGLQWIIGFPQMALYSLLASLIYFVVRLLMKPFSWKQKFYWLVAWLFASVIGLLLAAPLLIPTYELSLFSIRANGISGSMLGEKSLFPLALSTFLFPAARTFWGRSGLGSGAYIAIIPFLVALGAFFRRPKPNWFYPIVIMCITTAILAFGRFSPLFPIVRQIPGLSSFRVSSRLIFFTQFGLITLFGWNWDQLFLVPESTSNKRQERLFIAAIAIFVPISLIAYPLLKELKPQLINLASEITFNYIVNDGYHVQPEAYYLNKIEILYQNALAAMWSGIKTIAPLLSLVFGWMIIRLARRNRLSANAAYWGLAILIGIDLFAFTGQFNNTIPLASIVTKPETVELVDQITGDGLCRLYSLTDKKAITFQEDTLNLLPSDYYSLWDISGTGIYNPLGFYDYYRLLDNLGGVNLAFGLKPIDSAAVHRNQALLNSLNVCAITSQEALVGFELIGQADGVFVYRNDTFLPRAYAVDEVIILPKDEDAVTAVLENLNDLPVKAILQEELSEKLTIGTAKNAHVNIKEYQDTTVTIEVITEGTILLQLVDTNYPGWQVKIDGVPADILTTNALFRGVIVPKGEHEIIFSYVPNTFYAGLSVAIFALILLGLWIGIWLHRKVNSYRK